MLEDYWNNSQKHQTSFRKQGSSGKFYTETKNLTTLGLLPNSLSLSKSSPHGRRCGRWRLWVYMQCGHFLTEKGRSRGCSGAVLSPGPLPTIKVQKKGTAKQIKRYEPMSSDPRPRILLVCPVRSSFMELAHHCIIA